MVDAIEEATLTEEQVRKRVQALRAKQEAAGLQARDTTKRARLEARQRKERVNPTLIAGLLEGRDETWTIRAKPSHIKSVKALARQLSVPKAKISVAALMDEAIELLLLRYRQENGDA